MFYKLIFLIALVHSNNLVVLKLNVSKTKSLIEEEKLKSLLVPCFLGANPFLQKASPVQEGNFLPVAHLIVHLVYSQKVSLVP